MSKQMRLAGHSAAQLAYIGGREMRIYYCPICSYAVDAKFVRAEECPKCGEPRQLVEYEPITEKGNDDE